MSRGNIGLFLIAGFILGGCAQKEVENSLATKVSDESQVVGTQDLQRDARGFIESANLTSSQKANLKALQASTSQKMQNFRDESLKLRSILIKDVFALRYNKPEVKLIQNRIEKLEHRRVALIFETIDKANGILGRETDALENQKLMDRLMFDYEYQ